MIECEALIETEAVFLPAAKPTGLVEVSCVLSFHHLVLQKGPNRPNKHGSICSLGHKFQFHRFDLRDCLEAILTLKPCILITYFCNTIHPLHFLPISAAGLLGPSLIGCQKPKKGYILCTRARHYRAATSDGRMGG